MRIFLTSFFAILFLVANAQHPNYCGTEFTAKEHAWMSKLDRNVRLAAMHNKSKQTLYVPVKLHIVGNDGGGGYFTLPQVFDMFCSVNQVFDTMDVRFYIYGNIDYIANTTYYDHDWSGGSSMIQNHNVANLCNVYVVSDPAGNCGYAYYPGSGPNGGAVVLAKGCSSPNDMTFAHELGHYFSLPHTFDGWKWNPEFVDGSNCASAGDFFCDTEADYLDYRWGCPFTGGKLDPQGDPYDPNGAYIMSYSIEPCPYKFSDEQKAAMIYSLNNDRPYLLGYPDPPTATVSGTSTLLSPAEDDTIETKWVSFKWKSVPGATHYNFVLHRKNLIHYSRQDIIVTDTTVSISGLPAETPYEWRVKALTMNSTCAGYTDKKLFYYGTPPPSGISSALQQQLKVYPNPTAGNNELYFEGIDINDLRSIQIMDMQGRTVSENVVKNNNISLDGISNGVYFVRFVLENGLLHKKIIVD